MSSIFAEMNATGYERFMGRWSRVLAPQFLNFARIQDGMQVLDLGCGTGSLSRVLLDRIGEDGKVVGVDISSGFVEFANETIDDPRARFEVQDAAELKFETDQFDAAISLLVLNFVPESRDAVAQMVRVTKSGGTLAAATWDQAGGLGMMSMFLDTAAALDEEAATVRARARGAFLTREGELEYAFREAGALDVDTATLMIRMKFSDFQDYWSSFLSGSAYLINLDEERRERLRIAVMKAYCNGRPDGPCSFVAVANAVRARAP
jgi:ubiquinone/menaquinone biosynthesis C-methylase UbiE